MKLYTSILSFLKMKNGKLFRVKLDKQQRSHDGFGVRLGQGHPILKVSLIMEYQESTEKEASASDPHGMHPGWFELQISATLSNLIINKSNYGLRWRLHVDIFPDKYLSIQKFIRIGCVYTTCDKFLFI